MTNKSSQYYIVVFNQSKYDNHLDEELFPLINHTVYFSRYSFSYGTAGFNVFSNFEQKIRFFISLYCSKNNPNRKENLDTAIQEMRKVFPSVHTIDFAADQLGDNFTGYIAQSPELLEFFIKEEGIDLHEFLLNKKYTVLLYHGLSSELASLFSSPLINSANIEKMYSKEVMKHASDSEQSF